MAVVGVLIHGRGAYAYHVDGRFSHDANLILTVLLSALNHLCETTALPKHMHLQMDNCARENKNRFVLAFMSMLVQLNIFETVQRLFSSIVIPLKVELSFLPVGHTHNDIDQMFSKMSQHLAKNTVKHLDELCRAWNAAYSTKEGIRPHVFCVEEVADVKCWLEPLIAKNITGLAGSNT